MTVEFMVFFFDFMLEILPAWPFCPTWFIWPMVAVAVELRASLLLNMMPEAEACLAPCWISLLLVDSSGYFDLILIFYKVLQLLLTI